LSTTCEIPSKESTLSCAEANRQKLVKLREVVDTLLEKGLRRGFFGVIAVEVNIQDGTIQHIEERIQRKHR
jgi:hypothetical protein